MYATLECTTSDGVAEVRLNRPERLNAINRVMIDEIGELCRELAADQTLRAVVISGAGRAFCAGADINVLDTLQGPRDALGFIAAIQAMTNGLEALTMPTIAAINGIAFGGGCEIALACDMRLMANDAKIGVPEIKIGLLPGAGGSQRLARLLPPAIAKEMIYFGEPMAAERALLHGLVNQVCPPSELASTAKRMALRLTELPPLALRAAKTLVHGAALHGLHDGIVSEQQALGFLFGTQDGAEGIRSFVEKRRPQFRGR